MIQGFAYLLRIHAHLSPTMTFLALTLLLPLILLLAYGLFITVERRSLSPMGTPDLPILLPNHWRRAAKAVSTLPGQSTPP